MKLLILVFSALWMTTAQALLPPKYLTVPHWQHCVSSIKKQSAYFVCLPDIKPHQCPITSWDRLTQQKLIDRCEEGKNHV